MSTEPTTPAETTTSRTCAPVVPQARQRPSLEMEQAQMGWAVASLLSTGSSRADAVDERWD